MQFGVALSPADKLQTLAAMFTAIAIPVAGACSGLREDDSKQGRTEDKQDVGS